MESKSHVVVFPFMSKGHVIPLLHLTRLLLHRNLAVTVFTTPANEPFVTSSLSDVDVSIVSLPFPSDVPGIPPGVESTDKLPSMSLFYPFAESTKLLRNGFEEALMSIPNLKLMISDGFLHWTLQSANKFNIPRLAFYGMSYHSMVVSNAVGSQQLFSGPEHDDEPINVPCFPWMKLTRNDMSPPLNMRNPSGPEFDQLMEMVIATISSTGLLMNSFYELEHVFADRYNADPAPRAWAIGPLCLAEPEKKTCQGEEWAKWLDRKLKQGAPVLYIAFGTQAEVSDDQMKEITVWLERSEVSFLWVVRPKPEQEEIIDGIEERVKGKGLVVRDWIDQRAVLGHAAVKGFLSHCGWNSVMESICAGVPILAWPMMAEQHLNARMVVEEIKMGIRVQTCDGSVRGFVNADGLEKTARELMEGEMGKLTRKKAMEMGEAARKAMDEGGSSWLALESLLDEFNIGKPTKITA
ncbi:hypothetical protein V2J09_002414 [Rumex salicifolius]